ncbi:MAG: tetratricopeptide repeat protein [Acidobacteria bacterium]|nr:tetratricopeptide repeat protein [Acidobacteriota bacterium]
MSKGRNAPQAVAVKRILSRSGNCVLRWLLLAALLLSGAGENLSQQKEQAHFESGKASLAAGRLAEAIREFESVLNLNPLFSEAHFHLAEAHALTGNWDNAVLHARRAIELNPKSPAYRNQLAMIFVQQKRYKEALPELLNAIELKPANFLEFYYYNLAGVCRSLLLMDEALRTYEKVLSIAPKFYPAHVAVGEIYLERHLLEEAAQELTLATLLDSKQPRPYYLLGLAKAQAGKHSEALEAFRKALNLDPSDHRIHYNLGMSLKLLGQQEEAKKEFELFRTLQAKTTEEEYRDLQLEVSGRTDLKGREEVKGVGSVPTSGENQQAAREFESAVTGGVAFFNVASEAGVQFKHVNGATPEKYMPETMGSGCMFFDYDDDGWIDIFLVNSGSLADPKLAETAHHALYHNNGDGSFRNVTEQAHLDRKGSGYGMVACAADYDNDGHVDLYVTNFGSNVLYRNNGNGTFNDVTKEANVGSASWSSSCAFADIDKDGDLDLFVLNYVEFGVANNKYCGSHLKGLRSYCHPNVYRGLPNILYRNQGNGTFVEVGLTAGVAVDENGLPEAGMGTDWGDFNNDGLLDLYVTNLNLEMHTLHKNSGGGLFRDVTLQTGIGEASLAFVGFGTAFFDYDNDGNLDVVSANGHILDNVSMSSESTTYAQRKLLFHNTGNATFKEVGLSAGPGFGLEKVGRGLAVGDIDNDGAPDLLINNCNQTADLLRNVSSTGNNWLLIKTVGTRSNRDGIGTRLVLKAGELTQIREVKAGSSYQSQNDLRLHFGLGKASRVDRLELRWPSGTVDVLENIKANQILTVREGGRITRCGPYPKKRPSGT